jgi:hypothetical protein
VGYVFFALRGRVMGLLYDSFDLEAIAKRGI